MNSITPPNKPSKFRVLQAYMVDMDGSFFFCLKNLFHFHLKFSSPLSAYIYMPQP